MTERSDRDPAGPRADRVVLYLTAVAAFVQLLTSFVDRLSFSTITPSVVITVAFGLLVATTLLWSWLVRRRVSARTIVMLLVGTAAVVASWFGPLTGSDGNDTTEAQDQPENTSTPPTGDASTSTTATTATPAPTLTGEHLCATLPEVSSESWFLYQDAGSQHRIIIKQPDMPATSMAGTAFSAAGDHVVYVDVEDRSTVELMNLETEQLAGWRQLDGDVIDTTISADGQTVILLEDVAGDNRLILWRPSDNELTVLHDPSADLSAPALSPTADRLAWVEGPDSRLVVAELPALTQRELTSGGARDPAWSPDGSTVVYSAAHGNDRAIFAIPAGGGESWRLSSPVQQMDYDPAVRPGCDGVVYARARQEQVDLWQTVVGNDDEVFVGDVGAQSRPAFAGD